ncbi:hypothetical protein [Flavobacterium wongokense]|uniref:hypothetical protein n=1 Tax=Flavobacterium wongokense TaxID=2910674 RepID=UPI001F2704CA|nr:hypothetical protein [Flavobacterium sp. WG47]MCF6132325.1 hypothetical protein [Flavobacterium sp. WG47]
MSTPKNTEPIILILLTGLAVYTIIRGKKLDYLGHSLRHHIIKPSMKALKMKSKTNRELKREMTH